jgi:hypothetical protein
MKTKKILLACLLLGIGLTQLSAQNGNNGSGNLKGVNSFPGINWEYPVYCGGTLSDWIIIPDLTVAWTTHYVNGVETWGMNNVGTTEVILKSTGEVYTLVGAFDHWSDLKGVTNTRLHLIGEKGGRMSINAKIDWSTNEWYDIIANCH